MAFFIFQCTACEATLFPERFFCPRCGGGQWRQIEAGVGIVEQVTRLVDRTSANDPVLLATVRTEPDAWVIVRLDEPVGQGERVRLRTNDGGKVVASRE